MWTNAGFMTNYGDMRVNGGDLYLGDGSIAVSLRGFGGQKIIEGVSGATYLYPGNSTALAGTLQAGQYILGSGLAYGAVNSYTQIINGSTGAFTGTSATFSGTVAVNSTLTVSPDADSSLMIQNAGTNAIAMFAASGLSLIHI